MKAVLGFIPSCHDANEDCSVHELHNTYWKSNLFRREARHVIYCIHHWMKAERYPFRSLIRLMGHQLKNPIYVCSNGLNEASRPSQYWSAILDTGPPGQCPVCQLASSPLLVTWTTSQLGQLCCCIEVWRWHNKLRWLPFSIVPVVLIIKMHAVYEAIHEFWFWIKTK